MGELLLIVGLGWAILGVANLLMANWGTMSSTLGVVAIMFNVLLFILPGLILAGIGQGLLRRRAANKASQPPNTQERLANLDSLRAAGSISDAEYEQKRREILQAV
jgi:uncharacterized membrane protein